MSKEKDFGSIYGQTLSQCPKYDHDGLWKTSPVPGNIRRPPQDPAAVLADLQARYSDAALQESGVATMGPDGDVQLDPALCDANTAIIALRKTPQQDPYDLLTDRGGIANGEMPLCASLKDGQIKKMLKASDSVLYAACSSADAVALLSLGIPTTLINGMAQLSGNYLEDFFRCFKLGKSATQKHEIAVMDEEPPPHVVVVGWSPATLSLEEPEDVVKIVSHFSGIERHLGICLENFSLWKPTQGELDGIVFRLEHTDRQAVKAAISESLTSCRKSLVPPWTADDVPTDLATAIQRLHKLVSCSNRSADDERRAWKRVSQLIQSETTAPWFEQLEGAEDAAERNLLMLGATTSQMSHMQSIQLLLKLTTSPNQRGAVRPPGRLPDEEFQQFVKTSDLLVKIAKAIVQCRKNPF
ncbi:MAG: hypothetical protein WCJ35_15465 [Planctomycetota bacterium]